MALVSLFAGPDRNKLETLHLDLSGNSDLAKDDCVALNRIAKSIRPLIVNVIDKLTALNHQNIYWLVSPLASKNPFSSNFALQCARIVLFKEIADANPDKHFDVIVDSLAVRKILISISREKRISLRVRLAYFQLMKALFITPLKNFLSAIYQQIAQAVLIKLFTKKYEKYDLDHNFTVVTTFLYQDSFDSGSFRDKHFPYMDAYIKSNELRDLKYFPTFYKIKNYYRIAKYIRKNNDAMLFKEYYLRFEDYIFSFGCICGFSKFNFPSSIKLGNICISDLVAEEASKFRSSTIEAVLKYKAISRMREYGIQIKRLLLWFEGQDLDRAILSAFRECFPNSETVGYVGYVPSTQYLCMYPTEVEWNLKLTPKKLMVMGSGHINLFKDYCQSIDVHLAPALRYQFQETVKSGKDKDEGALIVFIALPIIKKSAKDIINRLAEVLSKYSLSKVFDKEVIFYIKAHPSNENFETIKFDVLDDGVKVLFSKEPFGLLADKARVVVSVASSACLEALAYGCSVIVMADLKGITYETIPQEIPPSSWETVFSAREFYDALVRFLKVNLDEKQNAINVRRLYFNVPNTENVRALLGSE